MQNQYHYLPCDIPEWGEKTKAHWAINPNRKAIIFVHGFNGSPSTTWNDFPLLLPNRKKCSGHDLVFYGYDSLYTATSKSAIRLYEFLDKLFTHPQSIINSSINPKSKRLKTFGYDHIILVAHSLGSIICRRALLNAHKSKKTWVNSTSMILFAPAHKGARVVPLALSALTGITWSPIKFFKPLLLYMVPVLEELQPDSTTIKDLLNDTQKVLQSGSGSFAKAHTVIWGEKDKIIVSLDFADDPVPKLYSRKNHMTVCKPSDSFLDPITDLLRAV